MPIQRYDQQHSKHQAASKNSKMKNSTLSNASSHAPAASSTNNLDSDEDQSKNINDIRRLIREQTNVSKNSRYYNGNSGDSSDELEVPIRKFTPLPDIPRMDDAYFRTESNLVKRHHHNTNHLDLDSEYSFIDDSKQEYAPAHTASGDPSSSSSSSTTMANSAVAGNSLNRTSFNAKQSRKETRYHFGSSNYASFGNGKKAFNHRLPSLEKNINHTIQSTMDLDEDLPMNPEPDRTNQRQIYTSPGDRIISPIKRPNAPSPVSWTLDAMDA